MALRKMKKTFDSLGYSDLDRKSQRITDFEIFRLRELHLKQTELREGRERKREEERGSERE
jgi:hypothetical protein